MSRLKKFLGFKPESLKSHIADDSTDGNSCGQNINKDANCETNTNEKKPSLREQLLEDVDFNVYVKSVAEQRKIESSELADIEIETLFEVWTNNKAKGMDASTLTTIGIGVIGALALVSPPAKASGIGEAIATAIVTAIEPFIADLLGTIMSAIGMDMSSGTDKVAAAAGKGVDAQNEVLKTIYNKEAARAAEPAPNECLSQEAAVRTNQAEQNSKTQLNDIVVRDQQGLIYIRHSIKQSIQRIAARRNQHDQKIYEAEGVAANAPIPEKVAAMTRAASVNSFGQGNTLDGRGKIKAEGHVAALFKDTAPSIDIGMDADTPTMRAHLDKQVELEATLNHCKNVFDRDIAERTGQGGTPSFRAAIAEKVASEYGSAGFMEEINAKSHSAPLLKTLIEQQSFSNMMAVKSYEQQTEMLKLQALQLKEAVKLSLS